LQDARRRIVRVDHFCLAGGGIFVPEGFRLEFSLQAALTLSRLKPVLHAGFGVQLRVQVRRSAFGLR